MEKRTVEFRDLTDRLGLTAEQTAVIVARSPATVRQYRSSGAHARVPTEDVMTALRTYWRSQLRARLEQAVSDMQAAGLDVRFGRELEAIDAYSLAA